MATAVSPHSLANIREELEKAGKILRYTALTGDGVSRIRPWQGGSFESGPRSCRWEWPEGRDGNISAMPRGDTACDRAVATTFELLRVLTGALRLFWHLSPCAQYGTSPPYERNTS